MNNTRMRREIEELCNRIVANEITSITRINRRLDDDDVCAIATALATNTSVTRINVEGNCICARGAQALAEALATNTSVVSVDLSRNLIGDGGASAVATMLAANKCITYIDMSINGINVDGIRALATALVINTSVIAISLAWNSITVAGMHALVDAFATNTTVSHISTHSSFADTVSSTDLGVLLKRNRRIAARRLVAITGHPTSALQRLPFEVYARILLSVLGPRFWNVELHNAVYEHLSVEKRRRCSVNI